LPVQARPYQPVELVQLSADSCSLLTPSNSTAVSKLTGLQFHHFGAEKFTTDIQSPLMVHTVTKAAATTTAAVSSIRQVPGPLRPAITTAHTIALGGYRIANATNARPRTPIIVLHPVRHQRADRCRRRRLPDHVRCVADQHSVAPALAAVTLTGAVAALAAPVVRRGLFGTSDQDTGYLGRRYVHWLATAWWHPLLVVGILMMLITVVGAAFSRIKSAKR
jgi:hypothetical protein